MFVFCKQKTAYDLRISDWSSDVCSSDLLLARLGRNPMSRAARRRRDRWPSREEAWTRLHDRGIYRGWRDDAFDCFIEHATRDEDGERALTCPKWLEAEIFDHPVYPWPAPGHLQCPVLFAY